MNPWHKRLLLLARLSLADLWHDRNVSLCMAASLVAVIAPLLLLFGLKHGVVSQLQQELLSDPRNLEVKMLSSGHFDQAWLQRLQARPEVGFAIGQTRSLNTQADLLGAHGRFADNVEVIPTRAGDPLLATDLSELAPDQVILSERAAERLDAKAGDTLRLRVARRLNEVNERGERTLQVRAIVSSVRFARPAAFVSPELLMELEHYRDGYLVASLGASSGQALDALNVGYARARVYARDIDSVAPLERWLNEQRIETASRLAEINSVKAINHVLGLIFSVIAGAALIGCIASLVGAFLANIDRKRRHLAVLRLLGFSSPAVSAYVVLQALVLSLVGYLGGLGSYYLGSLLFDRLLVSSQATGAFICHITVWHGLVALLLAFLVAGLVALIGALRAIRIQPAESLREL
ncbi:MULTISPECIES: ABC transporter permease [Pseudomonas]|uniref:FtsX-like permease family protein n=2 Tax=Pseudomonas putida TaxID=303 RepID=A0A7V8J5A2_PSEPU|nr:MULTISPECIES: ABC transporter permease [Pseudomonas]EKT4461698.1 ABC transporter permease [Pseudomonas putida]EKT4554413.1 ABC transporter permease [Pseudomonas putida]ELF6207075.1 ABC transporter permease [Pseudomonas putida]KAF0255514.1 FtsX-like permease family protein [Pseudomonas putida]KWW16269.1 ABC transporter permease [Pseudomonas putida]